MACPVCDDRVADGDLCPAHRALIERGAPKTLEKRTPPKEEKKR